MSEDISFFSTDDARLVLGDDQDYSIYYDSTTDKLRLDKLGGVQLIEIDSSSIKDFNQDLCLGANSYVSPTHRFHFADRLSSKLPNEYNTLRMINNELHMDSTYNNVETYSVLENRMMFDSTSKIYAGELSVQNNVIDTQSLDNTCNTFNIYHTFLNATKGRIEEINHFKIDSDIQPTCIVNRNYGIHIYNLKEGGINIGLKISAFGSLDTVENYGIKIDNPNTNVSAYSIYTGTAPSRFGGIVYTDTLKSIGNSLSIGDNSKSINMYGSISIDKTGSSGNGLISTFIINDSSNLNNSSALIGRISTDRAVGTDLVHVYSGVRGDVITPDTGTINIMMSGISSVLDMSDPLKSGTINFHTWYDTKKITASGNNQYGTINNDTGLSITGLSGVNSNTGISLSQFKTDTTSINAISMSTLGTLANTMVINGINIDALNSKNESVGIRIDNLDSTNKCYGILVGSNNGANANTDLNYSILSYGQNWMQKLALDTSNRPLYALDCGSDIRMRETNAIWFGGDGASISDSTSDIRIYKGSLDGSLKLGENLTVTNNGDIYNGTITVKPDGAIVKEFFNDNMYTIPKGSLVLGMGTGDTNIKLCTTQDFQILGVAYEDISGNDTGLITIAGIAEAKYDLGDAPYCGAIAYISPLGNGAIGCFDPDNIDPTNGLTTNVLSKKVGIVISHDSNYAKVVLGR